MKQNLYKAMAKTQKNIHKNKHPQKKSQYNTKYKCLSKITRIPINHTSKPLISF